LTLFALLVAVTWWRPPWPAEQALHSSLTVVAVAALVWVNHRVGLSLRTWVWALVFLSLHTIAARWLYSFVPYDDWTSALLGFRLSDVFGWHRNHFDRLVHFAYGLCVTMMLRLRPLRSLEFVLATSALYELFEWGVAVVLAPGMAEAYNGQQGDMWDPHKDMAMAWLGAAVAVLVIRWRQAPSTAGRGPAGRVSEPSRQPSPPRGGYARRRPRARSACPRPARPRPARERP
jgi:putative membrane protein